jgi:hypothetical protein
MVNSFVSYSSRLNLRYNHWLIVWFGCWITISTQVLTRLSTIWWNLFHLRRYFKSSTKFHILYSCPLFLAHWDIVSLRRRWNSFTYCLIVWCKCHTRGCYGRLDLILLLRCKMVVLGSWISKFGVQVVGIRAVWSFMWIIDNDSIYPRIASHPARIIDADRIRGHEEMLLIALAIISFLIVNGGLHSQKFPVVLTAPIFDDLLILWFLGIGAHHLSILRVLIARRLMIRWVSVLNRSVRSSFHCFIGNFIIS